MHGGSPADAAGIARQLADLGLLAEVSTASLHLAIAKDKWLAMVADRWMSLLPKFDDELAAGIAEIDARYDGRCWSSTTFSFLCWRAARLELGLPG